MTFAVKRILNHTYVSVPGAGRDEDSYERNVLAANRIPGLLTCRAEHLDGKTMLLFDVTSRQSLAVYLEKRRITAEMLRVILTGILRTAEHLEEYLLDPGHFVLKPAYVFLDAGAKETGLIYDTGYEGDFFEGLKELTGVLMANVPEDDHEAILLGYRISHELDAPAKDVTVLLGLLAGNAGREPQNEADLYAADPCEPYPEGRMDLFGEEIGNAGSSPEEKTFAEKEKRRRPTWLYGAAVALAGLLLVLLIYAYRSLLPAYPELDLPPWLLILPAAVMGLCAAHSAAEQKGESEKVRRETSAGVPPGG